MVAISYDPVDVLKTFTEKQNISYPLLSDPGSKTIRAYGLLNTEAKGKAEGVPYPGTFIVDGAGVIRAKLFHDGVIKRHTAADVIKAAEAVKD